MGRNAAHPAEARGRVCGASDFSAQPETKDHRHKGDVFLEDAPPALVVAGVKA